MLTFKSFRHFLPLLLVNFALFAWFIPFVHAEECTDYVCTAIDDDDERGVCVDKKLLVINLKLMKVKVNKTLLVMQFLGLKIALLCKNSKLKKRVWKSLKPAKR